MSIIKLGTISNLTRKLNKKEFTNIYMKITEEFVDSTFNDTSIIGLYLLDCLDALKNKGNIKE